MVYKSKLLIFLFFVLSLFLSQPIYAQIFQITPPQNTFLCDSDSLKVVLELQINSKSLPSLPLITSSDSSIISSNGIEVSLLSSADNVYRYKLDLKAKENGLVVISIESKEASNNQMPLYVERFAIRFGSGEMPPNTSLNFNENLDTAGFGLSNVNTFGFIPDLTSGYSNHNTNYGTYPIRGPIPKFVDIDNDGDLDVFAGATNYDILSVHQTGIIYFMENKNGVFQNKVLTNDTVGSIQLGISIPDSGDDDKYYFPSPTFGDIDNDGDLDMFVGYNRQNNSSERGGVLYFKNITPSADRNNLSKIKFAYQGKNPFGLSNQFPTHFLGSEFNQISPSLVDLDRDGDLDLFISTGTGTFHYFENQGTVSQASFGQRQDGNNLVNESPNGGVFGLPIRAGGHFPYFYAGQINVRYDVTTQLVDMDADGDYDLLFGDFTNGIGYFENFSDKCSPPKFSQTGFASEYEILYTKDRKKVDAFQTVFLADVDKDGHSELYTGRRGNQGLSYGLFSAKQEFYILDSSTVHNQTICSDKEDSLTVYLPLSIVSSVTLNKDSVITQFYSSNLGLVNPKDVYWDKSIDSIVVKLPPNKYGEVQLGVKVIPPEVNILTHKTLTKNFLLKVQKCKPTIQINNQSDSVCYGEDAFVNFTALGLSSSVYKVIRRDADTLFSVKGDSAIHQVQVLNNSLSSGINHFYIEAGDTLHSVYSYEFFSIFRNDSLKLDLPLTYSDTLFCNEAASTVIIQNAENNTKYQIFDLQGDTATASKFGADSDLIFSIDSTKLNFGSNKFTIKAIDEYACEGVLRDTITIFRKPKRPKPSLSNLQHSDTICYDVSEIRVRFNTVASAKTTLYSKTLNLFLGDFTSVSGDFDFNLDASLLALGENQIEIQVVDTLAICPDTLKQTIILHRLSDFSKNEIFHTPVICSYADFKIIIKSPQLNTNYFLLNALNQKLDSVFNLDSDSVVFSVENDSIAESPHYQIRVEDVYKKCSHVFPNKFAPTFDVIRTDLLIDTLRFCEADDANFTLQNTENFVTYQVNNSPFGSSLLTFFGDGSDVSFQIPKDKLSLDTNSFSLRAVSSNDCFAVLENNAVAIVHGIPALNLNLVYSDTLFCNEEASTVIIQNAENNTKYQIFDLQGDTATASKFGVDSDLIFSIDSTKLNFGSNKFTIKAIDEYACEGVLSDTITMFRKPKRPKPSLSNLQHSDTICYDVSATRVRFNTVASAKTTLYSKTLNLFLGDFTSVSGDFDFNLDAGLLAVGENQIEIQVVDTLAICSDTLKQTIILHRLSDFSKNEIFHTPVICSYADFKIIIKSPQLNTNYFLLNASNQKLDSVFNLDSDSVVFSVENDSIVESPHYQIRVEDVYKKCSHVFPNKFAPTFDVIRTDLLIDTLRFCEADDANFTLQNTENFVTYQVNNFPFGSSLLTFFGNGSDVSFQIPKDKLSLDTNSFSLRAVSSNDCFAVLENNAVAIVHGIPALNLNLVYSDTLFCNEEASTVIIQNAENNTKYQIFDLQGDTATASKFGVDSDLIFSIDSTKLNFGSNKFTIKAIDEYACEGVLSDTITMFRKPKRPKPSLSNLQHSDTICYDVSEIRVRFNTVASAKTTLYSKTLNLFLGDFTSVSGDFDFNLDAGLLAVGENQIEIQVVDTLAICPDTLKQTIILHRLSDFSKNEIFHTPVICSYADFKIIIKSPQLNTNYFLLNASNQKLDSVFNLDSDSVVFSVENDLIANSPHYQIRVEDVYKKCSHVFPNKFAPTFDVIRTDLLIDTLRFCEADDANFTLQNTENFVTYQVNNSPFGSSLLTFFGNGSDVSFQIPKDKLSLDTNSFSLRAVSSNDCFAVLENNAVAIVHGIPALNLNLVYSDTLFCNEEASTVIIQNAENNTKYQIFDLQGDTVTASKFGADSDLIFSIDSTKLNFGSNKFTIKAIDEYACEGVLRDTITIFRKPKRPKPSLSNLQHSDTICYDVSATRLRFNTVASAKTTLYSKTLNLFLGDFTSVSGDFDFNLDASLLALGENQIEIQVVDTLAICPDTLKQTIILHRLSDFSKNEIFHTPVICSYADFKIIIKSPQLNTNYFLLNASNQKLDSVFNLDSDSVVFSVENDLIANSPHYQIRIEDVYKKCSHVFPNKFAPNFDVIRTDLLIDSLRVCANQDAVFTSKETELGLDYFVKNAQGGTLAHFAGTGSGVLFRIDALDLLLGKNSFKLHVRTKNQCTAINQERIKVFVDSLVEVPINMNYTDTLHCEGDSLYISLKQVIQRVKYRLTDSSGRILGEKISDGGSELNFRINFNALGYGNNLLKLSTISDLDCFQAREKNFNVFKIRDLSVPIISNMPRDTTYYISKKDTVLTWGKPRVYDECGNVTLTSNFTSRSVFGIGDYSVIYRAVDIAGNISQDSFRIVVKGNVVVSNPLPVVENTVLELIKGEEKLAHLMDDIFFPKPVDEYRVEILYNPYPSAVDLDSLEFTISVRSIDIPKSHFKVKYRVCDELGGCAEAYLVVRILEPYRVDIPNVFSPNGDNIDDFFVIQGVQNFPNNSIQIINRWGGVVYEASPYKNDWGGVSGGKFSFGDSKLEEGTYFYIFDKGNGDTKITGYVYIVK